jgi:hypothetical protein
MAPDASLQRPEPMITSRTPLTRLGALLLTLAVVVIVVACGSGTATATPPVTAGPTAAPSAIPPDAADPSSGPISTPGTADVAAAIAFRQQFGLRSDEAWVRAVATNPDAVLDYGVPLLPFERDDIDQRATGEDAIVRVAQGYLQDHPDISGGLYIDQEHGGIVTVLVTADPAAHEAALRTLIEGAAKLAVRQVRWTEAELMDLQDRISRDSAFLAGLPARMTTSSVDVIGNRVQLQVSSAAPDVAAQIQTHFGAQPNQLQVSADGTGLLLQPTGRILGRVIAPAGTDFSSLSPQYEADVDIGPRDAVGIVVADDGTFTIDQLPPTGYTVTILQLGADDAHEVGRARVNVPPGGAARVDIPVQLP